MYFDLWKKWSTLSSKKYLLSACYVSCPLQGACRLSESIPQYTETDQRACFWSFLWQNILLPSCTDVRHPKWFPLKIPNGSNTFGFPFNLFGISAFVLPGTPPPPVLFSAVKGAGVRVLGPWCNQAVSYASLTPFISLQLLSVERLSSSYLMVTFPYTISLSFAFLYDLIMFSPPSLHS